MNDSVKNDSTQTETPITANTEVEVSVQNTAPATTKLEVIPNWKKIFLTWSFFFHVSSILLTFIDQLLPLFSLLEPTMTTQTYALTMFTLNALGLMSRFIKQNKLWQYTPPNGKTNDS